MVLRSLFDLLLVRPLIRIPQLVWRHVFESPGKLRVKLQRLFVPWILVFMPILLDQFLLRLLDNFDHHAVDAHAQLFIAIVADTHAIVGNVTNAAAAWLAAPLRLGAAMHPLVGWPLLVAYLWTMTLLTSSLFLAPLHVAVMLYQESRRGTAWPTLHRLRRSRAARLRAAADNAGAWLVGFSRDVGEPVRIDRRGTGDLWIVGKSDLLMNVVMRVVRSDLIAGRSMLIADSQARSSTLASLSRIMEDVAADAALTETHLDDPAPSLDAEGSDPIAGLDLTQLYRQQQIIYVAMPMELYPKAARQSAASLCLRLDAEISAAEEFNGDLQRISLFICDADDLGVADLVGPNNRKSAHLDCVIAQHRPPDPATAAASQMAADAEHTLCLQPANRSDARRLSRSLFPPKNRFGLFDLRADILETLGSTRAAVVARGSSAMKVVELDELDGQQD